VVKPDPQPPGTGPRFDTIELESLPQILARELARAHYNAPDAEPALPVRMNRAARRRAAHKKRGKP
jgi:hypothetical protein